MTRIDHHARLERLSALMEDAYHLREDWQDNYPKLSLDSKKPRVPGRFATTSCDGSDSWLTFYDSIESAAEGLADEIMGEVPYSPSAALDLDTGDEYRPAVTVKLQKLDAVIQVVHRGRSYADASALSEARVPAEEAETAIAKWRELGYNARLKPQKEE